jgi:DNA-binding NtrC family response regulator
VRQLEHALEAAAVLCEGPEVLPDDLPPEVAAASIPSASSALPAPTLPSAGPAVIRTLAEVEQHAIAAALDACGGNRSEAARRLGIGRNTLLRKLASAG